jgi:hypothetical protein
MKDIKSHKMILLLNIAGKPHLVTSIETQLENLVLDLVQL